MNGLVLFGYYPALPLAFRNQGSQPSFAYGHAMAGLNGDIPASSLPPFFREDKLETGPITGCTETSAAMVAAWATGNAALAQPITREAMQSAMGAQNTGVTPTQLVGGIKTVLGISTSIGTTWQQILDALGTTAWVADPLGYRWTRVTTADLRGFCTGHAGIISAYQTVIFTQTAIPDTATEDVVVIIQENFDSPRPVGIARGVTGLAGYALNTTTGALTQSIPPQNFPDGSSCHAGRRYTLGGKSYLFIVDGVYKLAVIPEGGGVTLGPAPAPGGITQKQLDDAVLTATKSGAHTAALAIADYATKTFPG